MQIISISIIFILMKLSRLQYILLLIILLNVNQVYCTNKLSPIDLKYRPPDQSNTLIELPCFPHQTNSPTLPKKDSLEEYTDRMQFRYLLNQKSKRDIESNLKKLIHDTEFVSQYQIQKGKQNYLNPENREKALFSMGHHYFNNSTPFTVGSPKIKFTRIISKEILDLPFLQIPLISIPFKTPYRTVYNAEQSFRYYINQFPKGRFTIPSLFAIAQCRIHQKDYLEAYINYKYALRILMEKNGYTNNNLVETYAREILKYTKDTDNIINIQFHISKVNSTNYFGSKLEYNENTQTIKILISYTQRINIFNIITNEN